MLTRPMLSSERSTTRSLKIMAMPQTHTVAIAGGTHLPQASALSQGRITLERWLFLVS